MMTRGFKHNAAGGNTQHDGKHECVMELHSEQQKRKTQAQQSPQNSFKHLMMRRSKHVVYSVILFGFKRLSVYM
jgi:hypothetical protein